jgi:predicted dehydrogenase
MQAVKPRRPARVLVVGVGRAAALALEALSSRDDAAVVAAVDPAPAAVAALPPTVPLYASLDAVPASVEADVAIVATPTPTHTEICHRLVARRAAPVILCEKPLATDVGDAEAALDAAAAAGVALRVLYHYAHAPEVLAVRDELAALVARHGPVETADAAFADPYTGDLDERSATLVSSWIDSGINALSVLARFVDLRRVLDSDLDAAGPAHGAAVLAFEHGGRAGRAHVATSWTAPVEVKRTTLEFADGTELVLDHPAGAAELRGGDARTVLHRGGPGARLARYRSLLAAHLGDEDVYGRDETLALHALLTAAATTAA